MDLALEFGMPAEQLARQMSEREFGQWMRYAARRMLPTKRLEAHMAQITKWIAMTMGGVKDATIAEFMIEPEPENVDLEDVKEAFQFQPRKREA